MPPPLALAPGRREKGDDRVVALIEAGLSSRTESTTEGEGDSEELDLAAERHRRRRRRLRKFAMSIAGLTLAAIVWEIASLIVADPITLPSVQTTVSTFLHYFNRPYPTLSAPLWEDMAISTERVLIGFALGTCGGLVIGATMHAVKPIRELVDPIIEVTRPLPPLAFIPLLIVWFGIGEVAKIVLIIIGVLPVTVVATVAALQNVPLEMEQCARTLGASRKFALVHVQIRAAIPGIVTGMRIAMAGAWTSIVAAELIAATSGVGYLIEQAGNSLQTSLVFCGIISIGAIGLFLDSCLRLILRWADPSRR
jgi:ABC-type nitrate/sulfonate/bicarbonate transport system permease component